MGSASRAATLGAVIWTDPQPVAHRVGAEPHRAPVRAEGGVPRRGRKRVDGGGGGSRGGGGKGRCPLCAAALPGLILTVFISPVFEDSLYSSMLKISSILYGASVDE